MLDMFCRYYSYFSGYWQGTVWRFPAEFCGCLYHWTVCANLEHFVCWKGLCPGVWPPCSLCFILLHMLSSCGGIQKAIYVHEIITAVCEGVFVLKACNMKQWSTYSATIV